MKILILIFVIIFPSASKSEPSESIKYLMNEPVSLLDLGIYKLENDFKEAQIYPVKYGFKYIHVTVYYNYKQNRIRINGFVSTFKPSVPISSIHISEPASNLDEAKELCKQAIYKIKAELDIFIDPETGKSLDTGSEHSNLVSYFSHTGYTTINEPKYEKLASELDNITIIEGKVLYIDSTNKKKKNLLKRNFLACESMLRKNKILFSE